MVFRIPNVKLDKAQFRIIAFKLKYLQIHKIPSVLHINSIKIIYLQKKDTFNIHFHNFKSR